ncbi:hypothetical protein BQ8420_08565 [Nocardiopsis sp. JB363]|nr:hypothetical protein BQ8420_08565 [Nocardiopsis sp. JB363]
MRADGGGIVGGEGLHDCRDPYCTRGGGVSGGFTKRTCTGPM